MRARTRTKMQFHLHGRGGKVSFASLNLARPLMANHFRAQTNSGQKEGSCKYIEQMKARSVSSESTLTANDSMCEFTSLMKANLISTSLSPAVSADADVSESTNGRG